ncbi:hypothetical protein QAD02_023291, partial [Eretmocerus hayati]
MIQRPAHIISFVTIAFLVSADGSLETVYQWKYFDFVWPSQAAREQAIKDGSYNYSNIRPYDNDVSRDGRVFVSFPFFKGTPVRLGYVTGQQSISGPLIQPYPNWEWFNWDSCDNTILTVVRFKIDQCNRLWIVDTGIIHHARKCPAKLMIFDLSRNTLLRKVTIPHDIVTNQPKGLTNRSYITTIIIDSREKDCSDAI